VHCINNPTKKKTVSKMSNFIEAGDCYYKKSKFPKIYEYNSEDAGMVGQLKNRQRE
jgi:hypothetical protein